MKLDMKNLAQKSLLIFKDNEEAAEYEKYLLSILEIIDTLPKFDEDPFPFDKSLSMELREDKISPSIKRELLLENAPLVEAGCFSVSKIMNE